MRNFYTVFDYENNRIKMAVNNANSWASESMIKSGGLSPLVIAIIVISCIVVTAIILALVYKCYKKNKSKRDYGNITQVNDNPYSNVRGSEI